jgi:hypothetical protein
MNNHDILSCEDEIPENRHADPPSILKQSGL